MWSLADRVKASFSVLADVTVGTVIVLVHVALADRTNRQHRLAAASQQPDAVARA